MDADKAGRRLKIIVFGASGMVGQGVLRECLLDPEVETILLIGRSAIGKDETRIREIVHKDLANLAPIESELRGYDACFFCLGVSSVGMSEADYKRITYDLTIGAATTLARLNSQMTFIYVSGLGTDSSEKGSAMWARVKGATENALLRMPFKAAWMFRPGFIQPKHGEYPRKAVAAALIKMFVPLFPLILRLAPNYATTTERIGLAMLIAAKSGAPKPVLESADINALTSSRP